MNFVLLMGRFVADPELKKTTSGKSVCAFTLAVDKGKDRGADFIDTVAWEKTAEFICKYFKKGSPIVIEGAVQTRTYEDKNGQKRKAVENQCEECGVCPEERRNERRGAGSKFRRKG